MMEKLKVGSTTSIFSEIDRQFARFMVKLSDDPVLTDPKALLVASAIASNAVGRGNICTLLSQWAGRPVVWTEGEADEEYHCPDVEAWEEMLAQASVVGRPGEFKPLILDTRHRLYLHRYWTYERQLADIILEKAKTVMDGLDDGLLKDGIERLFPGEAGGTDWQRVAAFAAVNRAFTAISGGPGTGKTYTVVKILALLLEQSNARGLIALCAPTGKAAARLRGMIRELKPGLDCSPEVKAMIPEEASTIHRLLGPVRWGRRFRFNEENRLPYDVVVVDESSMSDLPLMAKLAAALPEKSRLILLGDKDQLASVEPGAVFGDICDTGESNRFSPGFSQSAERVTGCSVPASERAEQALSDSVVVLTKSYRFAPESGIGRLSRLVKAGDGAGAIDLLKNSDFPDISWRPVPQVDSLSRVIEKELLDTYAQYLKSASAQEAFERFNAFHLLCALREGPHGVVAINETIEDLAVRTRLIRRESRWYRGRPVMIVSNDYRLKLYNGDVGILFPDADEELRAFFPTEEGSFRRLGPSRLSAFETAYAITVHKSQGSEFNHVLLLLPDRYSEVVTRELVYTGITRAKKKVEIWGREESFIEAVSRQIRRESGLKDRLTNR
jgi:exodeoxyribonuclease V alpha subunit